MSAQYRGLGKRFAKLASGISPILVLLSVSLCVPFSAYGSTRDAEDMSTKEYDVKAVFLYHFTRYLQWPKENESDVFDIEVIGRSEITGTLQAIAGKRNVGPLPIRIRQCRDAGEIGHPHILYIARSAIPQLARILEKTRNTAILTVGEMEGLGRHGVAINFVEKDGNIKFEISEKRLEAAGIRISSQLLKLAILIDDERMEGDR